MAYIIEDTKTKNGERFVPMGNEVMECFRRIIANRKKPAKEPMVALHWEHYFKHILNKYNSIYKVQLPKITPHVCRHTFCSNMAKSGMNLKTLQYIMGHSDISITVDIKNPYEQLKKLKQLDCMHWKPIYDLCHRSASFIEKTLNLA